MNNFGTSTPLTLFGNKTENFRKSLGHGKCCPTKLSNFSFCLTQLCTLIISNKLRNICSRSCCCFQIARYSSNAISFVSFCFKTFKYSLFHCYLLFIHYINAVCFLRLIFIVEVFSLALTVFNFSLIRESRNCGLKTPDNLLDRFYTKCIVHLMVLDGK